MAESQRKEEKLFSVCSYCGECIAWGAEKKKKKKKKKKKNTMSGLERRRRRRQ